MVRRQSFEYMEKPIVLNNSASCVVTSRYAYNVHMVTTGDLVVVLGGCYHRGMVKETTSNTSQEVSRVRSTKRSAYVRNPALYEPFGKEQIRREMLPPFYVVGFIDGEGSFSVSIGKHKTLKRGLEVRAEFEIELRADDREIEILERLLVTIGCGKIYDCSYERYGWYPHVKYKVTSTKDMEHILFPFFNQYPLQAKKAEVYRRF